MNLNKLIRDTIRKAAKDGDVVAPVNEAVAVNTGERGSTTAVSTRQHVVHRDGETEVREERVEYSD